MFIVRDIMYFLASPFVALHGREYISMIEDGQNQVHIDQTESKYGFPRIFEHFTSFGFSDWIRILRQIYPELSCVLDSEPARTPIQIVCSTVPRIPIEMYGRRECRDGWRR